MTSGHLVPTYAKCMLYGLGNMFPIENVYSAGKVGKANSFSLVLFSVASVRFPSDGFSMGNVGIHCNVFDKIWRNL